MAPDLRASPVALQLEAFREVVKNGSKLGMGMPVYPNFTDDELLSLMHFIRKAARDTNGIDSSTSHTGRGEGSSIK